MSEQAHPPNRVALAYANFIVRRPLVVLAILVLLGIASTYAAVLLRGNVNTNQLDLISQDLQEVKDVKRMIDMVGGAGYLILTLRSTDDNQMKATADDIAAMLEADKEHVRFITYKVPVEFIQRNMVLFVKTEDLREAKTRINAYLRDQIRRANPFYIEIKKTEPVKLELQDIVDRYSHVGQKSIMDDYYISDDRKMMLILVKPMWDSNELGKTKKYIDETLKPWLTRYQGHGVKLVEDYSLMGDSKTIAYGFTGTYKLAVDDSYAIDRSIEPITFIAFASIALIAFLFFRRVFPSVLVIVGMVLGTVLTMGFTYLTVGSLNMVTSMMAGLLMGFGVDFGLHFTFRTRLELGAGKPYDVAIRDALINAGRPALVSAVVTGGSFAVLMVSEFRGFSQFGFLSACGTLILGFTLFSFCPAILVLLGRWRPTLPERLVGIMPPPRSHGVTGKEIRIPNPKLMLGICVVVVGVLCAFATPWTDYVPPKGHVPTLWERLKGGVHFDYNTRALIPEDQYSVKLNDEINERFRMSSDPIGVYTPTLEATKELWDELNPLDPKKYSTISQVVSIYSFVPPKETAEANAKILAEWQEELKDIDVASLPPEVQDKAALFKEILAVRPFDVNGVPDIYASQFRELPTTKPENRGFLTFIYPKVDLWDGKNNLLFADQTSVIRTKQGNEYRSAGAPVLYAKLARIVLADGRLTVFLAALFVLLMHYADFRSVQLAAASVIPLVIGLVVTLGMMSLINARLNFMNIIMLPLLLGFGVSHGLYLLHRFLEGVSPVVALSSVGAAVASSTLTNIAGFGALFAASHNGLKSMGLVACLGLFNTLVVTFTVLAAVMQVMHDQRRRKASKDEQTPPDVPAEPMKESA